MMHVYTLSDLKFEIFPLYFEHKILHWITVVCETYLWLDRFTQINSVNINITITCTCMHVQCDQYRYMNLKYLSIFQACAPRYVYLSTQLNKREPVGTCYLARSGSTRFEEFSPCRGSKGPSQGSLYPRWKL